MPGFFTAHRIDGMSRAAARERAETLTAATVDEPVELVRVACDLQAGRMLCEWIANTQQEVLDYLKSHELELLAEDEWIMHADLEEPPTSPPLDLDPNS